MYVCVCVCVRVCTGLAGGNQDVVVLLAGMSGDVASAVSKKLMTKGIHTDRILFADFF